MKFEKIYNKGQARLFQNNYIEYLTKTHPLVIWSIYLPVIVGMFFYSYKILHVGFVSMISLFVIGIFSWTFFEYLIHRFLFHFISENKEAMKVIYILHGNHHEYPRDKERLFMPPIPSMILAIAIFSIVYFFFFTLGIPERSFCFFSGFLLGYLLYGSMHYAIHAWKPPLKSMKSLWRNHHLHHYSDEHKGFGVSTTFWDRLFDTMYKPNNKGF